MPTVSEQFKTYRDFASATLSDIYGERLDIAFKLTANHLESGVWMNESVKGGDIKFRWVALPWDAQLSPVNDIASADLNGDGKLELVLAQNHFTNWMETGLWRGNPGCHLEWSGKSFTTIPHKTSGIVLPGDTKAIISIDANGNGKQDILAAPNNSSLLLFTNE